MGGKRTSFEVRWSKWRIWHWTALQLAAAALYIHYGFARKNRGTQFKLIGNWLELSHGNWERSGLVSHGFYGFHIPHPLKCTLRGREAGHFSYISNPPPSETAFIVWFFFVKLRDYLKRWGVVLIHFQYLASKACLEKGGVGFHTLI